MASDKSTERAKPFLILTGFLLVWWLIPVGWKLATRSSFREFQAPIWELASRAEDLTEYWGHLSDSKKTLIEKGREIARGSAALEAKPSIPQIKLLRSEITRLETALSMPPEPGFKAVVARVTRRDLSAWWQNMTLRKGGARNLTVGAGVVSANGVAGRVSEVGIRWATVRLVTSPQFRVAAQFEGDDRPVTFQGGGIPPGGKPFGVVRNVPHDLSPIEGKPLRLLTSSLGGTFPAGISIGFVNKLEGGEDGLFKSGRVELDELLGKLREVTVLLPRDDSSPDR